MSGVWTDKDGLDWRIEYMEDDYIINCIRYIKKRIDNEDGFLVPPVYYDLIYEYNERIEKAKNG